MLFYYFTWCKAKAKVAGAVAAATTTKHFSLKYIFENKLSPGQYVWKRIPMEPPIMADATKYLS
jgi:hypothetical protein